MKKTILWSLLLGLFVASPYMDVVAGDDDVSSTADSNGEFSASSNGGEPSSSEKSKDKEGEPSSEKSKDKEGEPSGEKSKDKEGELSGEKSKNKADGPVAKQGKIPDDCWDAMKSYVDEQKAKDSFDSTKCEKMKNKKLKADGKKPCRKLKGDVLNEYKAQMKILCNGQDKKPKSDG